MSQRVLDARSQARAALGRDPVGGGLYDAPPRHAAVVPSPLPVWSAPRPAERPDESQRVFSRGEAASRLNISRSELEAMIAAGKIETLPTGFTRMIPTREVERLKR